MGTKSMESEIQNVAFNNAAIYQISVMGELNTSWSSRLANMQISLDKQIGGKNVYVLIGKLKDQAELIGIINTLYDLHLSLIEVKIL